VVNEYEKWSNAKRACATAGGRLASVTSSTDPVITAAQLIPQAHHVWMGLSKERTDWHYTTGTVVKFRELSFGVVYLGA